MIDDTNKIVEVNIIWRKMILNLLVTKKRKADI